MSNSHFWAWQHKFQNFCETVWCSKVPLQLTSSTITVLASVTHSTGGLWKPFLLGKISSDVLGRHRHHAVSNSKKTATGSHPFCHVKSNLSATRRPHTEHNVTALITPLKNRILCVYSVQYFGAIFSSYILHSIHLFNHYQGKQSCCLPYNITQFKFFRSNCKKL